MAKTGRREVAEAVAAVSGLVTVNLLAGDSFITTPGDLFSLQFNDPRVGIDDTRMPDFKAALIELLQGEGIDDTISQIPNNANIQVGQVADIVSAALAV